MKNFIKLAVVALAMTTAFQAKAEITKNERVLVVVSELDVFAPRESGDLYRTLERLTRAIPNGILASEYSRVIGQYDRVATSTNFVNLLRTLAMDEHVKAIDVILSLHGSPDRLYFFNGGTRISDLSNSLLRANTPAQRDLVTKLKKKLRLMYNLSCYGKSVNEEFVSMGFDTSIGSVAVNANSDVEFPSFVGLWRVGFKVSDALAPTNNDFAIFAHDGPMVTAGRVSGNTMLQQINSKKEIEGRTSLKINTDPR